MALLRRERDVAELEREVAGALTPEPNAPGAQGIVAHRRLLEMDDEIDARKLEADAIVAGLDRQIAEKDEEVTAAEDYLDQALFLLGEECYRERVAHPELSALYARLDKAGGGG